MSKVKCEISFECNYEDRKAIEMEVERIFGKFRNRKYLINSDVVIEMKPFQPNVFSMKRLKIEYEK